MAATKVGYTQVVRLETPYQWITMLDTMMKEMQVRMVAQSRRIDWSSLRISTEPLPWNVSEEEGMVELSLRAYAEDRLYE